jgi:ABC-type multidrug transport system fused ATPase/permease subunit
LESSLSPIPNITSFGLNGVVFASIFYDGVEQFYCQADSCQQSVFANSSIFWACDHLQCVCHPGSAFCGGGLTNLSVTLDGLNGSLDIDCSPASGGGGGGQFQCYFIQSTLQSLFGASGLPLNSCEFGECVLQSVIDAAGSGITTAASTNVSHPLSGGVIGGLVVVGFLLLLAFALGVLGYLAQRRARRARPLEPEKTGGVSVEWSGVSYVIPGTNGGFFGRNNNKKKKEQAGYNDDKAILDNLSGRVRPGQVMAILGPSGKVLKDGNRKKPNR